METLLKTKDVAEKLNVNQKTVQRWIKHFRLKCDMNELGHYVVSNKIFKQLIQIQEQLKYGKKLSEVALDGFEKKLEGPVQMVSSRNLDERFSRLLFQIEQLDRKIQNKAGDIVGIQTLQHRKEIDDITETLVSFEIRLRNLETNLNNEANKIVSLKQQQKVMETKKGRLASIFHF